MKPNKLAVGVVLGLLLILALYALLTWGPDKGPGEVAAAPCTSSYDCNDGQVCCGGACAAQCADDSLLPPTEKPREEQGTKKLPELTAFAGKLPERERDESARDPSLAPGACKEPKDCPTGLMGCEEGTCKEPPVCLVDEDCLGARKCFTGKCVDEFDGCRLQDCMPNGYCHARYNECEKHNCKTDKDCAGGRRCDDRQSLCVDCLEDSDCEGGARCTDGWFCLPKGGCAGDGDCEGGAICDWNSKQCSTAACVDDDQEDNDKWNKAKPLEPGEYDFTACPRDNDYYRIDLAQGEGLIAHAGFNNLSGMIELRLYDVHGVEIWRAGDHNMTGDISLVWERAQQDSIYYLGVEHRFGLGLDYHLNVQIWPSGICRNDEYEPNNDAGVAATVNQRFRWEMKLCEGDDDWILQSVKKGQKFSMSFDVAEGENARVEVFRDQERKPFWRDDSSERYKVLEYTADRDADFYIRISPMYPRSETLYGLRLELKD